MQHEKGGYCDERFYLFLSYKGIFRRKGGVKGSSVRAGKGGEDRELAYSGGSAIDCCKIIAAQAVTDEDIWTMEFKEHIYPTEFLPMGAVVTASGTGAEMNNGAVITNEDTKEKAGDLRSF